MATNNDENELVRVTTNFTEKGKSQLDELCEHFGVFSSSEMIRRLVSESWNKNLFSKYKQPIITTPEVIKRRAEAKKEAQREFCVTNYTKDPIDLKHPDTASRGRVEGDKCIIESINKKDGSVFATHKIPIEDLPTN